MAAKPPAVVPPRNKAPVWEPRRIVNIDFVEHVTKTKSGVHIVARRGGREYRINVPEDVAYELALRLRQSAKQR